MKKAQKEYLMLRIFCDNIMFNIKYCYILQPRKMVRTQFCSFFVENENKSTPTRGISKKIQFNTNKTTSI